MTHCSNFSSHYLKFNLRTRISDSKRLTENCLSGGSLKTRSRLCRKAPVAKNTPEVRRNPEVNGLPDCAMVHQLSASSLLSTPKRSRRIQQSEARLTSTPVKSSPDVFSNIAETLSGPNPVELEYTEHIPQSKVTF